MWGSITLNIILFEQLRARRKVSKGTAGSVLVTNKDGTETAWESIVDYVKRSVDHRFVLLYRGMLTAFAERPPQDYDVTFLLLQNFIGMCLGLIFEYG